MGRVLDLAKRDVRRYVNNEGFNQELVITPTGLDPVTVQGLATRHTSNYDTEGKPINSENIHCSFSELDLNDLLVITRNAAGYLNIRGWIVEFTDSLGSAIYKISESQPDNTLGIIRCTLTNYE